MSNYDLDAFEDVQRKGTVWEPKSTGTKKAGDLKALEATDKSYFVGYYMGSDENAGPNSNSTVHYFKLGEVGDKAHLKGDPSENDNMISVWGTGVLDDRIKEGVSEGDFCLIKWLGKKMGKTGNAYHNWKVGVNKNVEPLATATPKDEFAPDDVTEAKEVITKNEHVLDNVDDDFDDL